MFKNLNNKRAQSVMGEYVMTFFLIIGVMTAMTIFFKRALQGRIRDARIEMGDIVLSRAGGEYVGNLYTSYEPYYLQTNATVNRSLISIERLSASAGASSGIFNKVYNESSVIRTKSETMPPQLGD